MKKQLVLSVLVLFLIAPCYSAEPEGDNLNEYVFASEDASQDSNQPTMVFVPGDAVSISTLPDTTSFLNGVFPIDDRGFVELPIYGKAKISHMSKEQFVNFLRENFKDYIRYPTIYVKPMIRLSVLGGVPRPGFYYFDYDRSLWEVLYEVGGTIDENGLREMRWERNGHSVEDNLIPHLQTGISLRRMGFRTGDQIWVKTPGKPGFLERARGYLSIATALASFLTLYITYQRFIVQDR